MKPEQMSANYASDTAINGVTEVSPHRLFYTYLNNFSWKAVRLPKNMPTSQTADTSSVIHAVHIKPWRGFWLGISEEDNQVYPIPGEDVTSGVSIAVNVSAVHYKSTKNKESQMTRYHVVESNDSKRLSEDSRMEVHESDK